jgi:hypothetical protein
MKAAALALAALLPCMALAERDAVPAPDNWRRESFHFPLAFAPSIGLEGDEHVRFAPGWADFAGERGFSYVFLWDVKEVDGPALTVVGIEFAMRVYFDGLMSAAAGARKIEPSPTPTTVDLHPMRDEPDWAESHAGRIYTWNGFSKAEPLELEVEVTKRSCPNGKAQVFYAISKAKRSAPIWAELRKARQGVTCSASG